MGTKVRSQRTAVLCAVRTSEAGISQYDYSRAVHVMWLILVRTYEAFVLLPPTHPCYGADRKHVSLIEATLSRLIPCDFYNA